MTEIFEIMKWKMEDSGIFSRVEKIHIEKIRAYVTDRLFLDVYYSLRTGSYSYVLVDDEKRVLGWNDAEHSREEYRRLSTYPHHKHSIEYESPLESEIIGDPLSDLDIVLEEVKEYLRMR